MTKETGTYYCVLFMAFVPRHDARLNVVCGKVRNTISTRLFIRYVYVCFLSMLS